MMANALEKAWYSSSNIVKNSLAWRGERGQDVRYLTRRTLTSCTYSLKLKRWGKQWPWWSIIIIIITIKRVINIINIFWTQWPFQLYKLIPIYCRSFKAQVTWGPPVSIFDERKADFLEKPLKSGYDCLKLSKHIAGVIDDHDAAWLVDKRTRVWLALQFFQHFSVTTETKPQLLHKLQTSPWCKLWWWKWSWW